MHTTLVIVLAGIGLFVTAAPARAHHSFAAEYDASRTLTMTGTVTKVEWTNPHAHFFMDARETSGGVANWSVELAGPKALAQCGWRMDTLHVGDEVTVQGASAKDGSHHANARLVTLPGGRVLSAASSGGDVPPSQ